MKQKYRKKPKQQQDIAKERISILFSQAKRIFNKSPKLSNRYVHLARKIAMKYKVKIPKKFKRRFCKHCYSYLVPSKTCRVRLQKSKVVYYCMNCKKYMRFQIK
jgi:ribonuclease P protein subunit RPR2|tara:strand:- start:949 stop:1260 length:312 start_codon:yes stop_codon:yes gene_type:complete